LDLIGTENLEETRALASADSYKSGKQNAALAAYFNKIMPALVNSQAGENYAASPVNIFMALAMLAEITDGETRAQILDLIGTENLEETRALASAIWQANYTDDGITKCLMAASVWINEEVAVRKEKIAELAQYYYATAWLGSPKDADFSKAFKEWLNEQTGGLLKDAVNNLADFDEDLILALATTIYFKAPWADEFMEHLTSKDTFHCVGKDVEADFMHSGDKGTVYYGNGFIAIKLRFANEGGMWIILPDEGISPESLVGSAATDFLLSEGGSAVSTDYGIIRLSLPKFDVDATTDLVGILQQLGVSDAFNPDKADFSPLTDTPAVVTGATHSARVKIDEEGVEAAAFTVMTVGATAFIEQPKEIEFNANRPFIFAITGIDGLPLFIGTVNNPT
ncbi:MAG: hypothetical protein IKZ78_01745, partial [Firmicutes bacterium]|nr:hypothetical protein [Bacillota bacterium]